MAARIERAECETVLASDAASRPRPRSDDPRNRGGSAVFAGRGSDQQTGRPRFAGPVDEDALAMIEGEVRRARGGAAVELATLADPPPGRLLTGRGYEPPAMKTLLGCRSTATSSTA